MRKSKLALLALIPLTLLLAACEEEASEVDQGVHFSEKRGIIGVYLKKGRIVPVRNGVRKS